MRRKIIRLALVASLIAGAYMNFAWDEPVAHAAVAHTGHYNRPADGAADSPLVP